LIRQSSDKQPRLNPPSDRRVNILLTLKPRGVCGPVSSANSQINHMTNYSHSRPETFIHDGFGFSRPLSGHTAAPAVAQEPFAQYLSGHDGEPPCHGIYLFRRPQQRRWTNIAVPSCWEIAGLWKFRYGAPRQPYTPSAAIIAMLLMCPATGAARRVFICVRRRDDRCDGRGQRVGLARAQGAFYRSNMTSPPLLKFGEDNLPRSFRQ